MFLFVLQLHHEPSYRQTPTVPLTSTKDIIVEKERTWNLLFWRNYVGCYSTAIQSLVFFISVKIYKAIVKVKVIKTLHINCVKYETNE